MNLPALRKATLIFLLTISMPCLGQKDNVIVIKTGQGGTGFSYWSSLSTIPINDYQLRKIQPDAFKRASGIFELPADQPLLFNFSSDYKIQFVWLFPGDTLEVFATTSDSMPLEFSGSRPYKELMFYSMMEASNLGFLQGNPDLEMTSRLNFQYIADQAFDRYQSRVKLLNNCMASETFSNRGKRLITKGLYYQYLGELLLPYQAWIPISEVVNNHKIVPEFYKAKLRELSAEFNQDSLMYLFDYRRFVLQYARFLAIDGSTNRNVGMPTLLNFYKGTFSGRIRDCLLFDEIYSIYLARKRVPKVDDVIGSIGNDSLRNILISLKTKSKSEFSVPALETELETSLGEKLTLREALSKHFGQSVYLDFWATWCGPCLMEMPDSKQLAQEFQTDSVAFFYISIDHDKGKWVEKIKNLPHGRNIYHYYLGEASDLAKDMDIWSIPRYFLIGKNRQIISSNAPRPKSKEIRELIIKSLE